MDLKLLTIWLSFVFCLALTAGGILLLFRFKSLRKLSGYKYIQYSAILLYTFGFYSLWSQIFIELIPESIQFASMEFIRRTIFLMGTPFLLFGLVMQIAWAFHTQASSVWIKTVTYLLPILLLGAVVALYLANGGFQSADLVELYSWIALSLITVTSVLFLTGRTTVMSSKWRTYLIATLVLSGLIYLLNFFPIIPDPYHSPVFILLFFLTNTIVEGIYMYNAKIDESRSIKSFADFVEKFQITNREAEIVREIYNGKSNQEIADVLFVTLQTVKDHSSRIYQKTQVRSRAQVIALLREYL